MIVIGLIIESKELVDIWEWSKVGLRLWLVIGLSMGRKEGPLDSRLHIFEF